MRPDLVLWLEQHGVSAWLAPDYFVMSGLGAWLGCILCLRLARRDGARVWVHVRALIAGYVGAFVFGSVVEWLRVLPRALMTLSWSPFFEVGRAAWGGLLGAIACSALVLMIYREPLGAFFDRTAVGAGVIFGLVRTGCFLAGCDYGRPTASSLGVRFPVGSFAAEDHLARGWIAATSRSLPVHPTQLYEAAWGFFGGVVCWFLLERLPRDGRVFALWVSFYALGRFAIEALRGDVERGLYAGLSTAQITCLLVLTTVAIIVLSVWRRRRYFTEASSTST